MTVLAGCAGEMLPWSGGPAPSTDGTEAAETSNPPRDREERDGEATAPDAEKLVCGDPRSHADAPAIDTSVPRQIEKAVSEFERGLALARKGDHAGALAAYGRAIALDPLYGLAYLEKAESHLYTDNDHDAMRTLLARAVLLMPSNPRAHLRYADLCDEIGRKGRAEAHWRCALNLRPDLAEARRGLGRRLFEDGRLGEAEEQLRLAVRSASEDVQTLLLLADVLEARKRYVEAGRTVETAARIADRSAALYRRAGALYEQGGNVVAARRARAAADHLDPPAKDRRVLRPLPKARARMPHSRVE